MIPTLDNYVIINIWLPHLSNQIGDSNQYMKTDARTKLDDNSNFIGHITIETPKYYVSCRPNPNNPEEVGIFKVMESKPDIYEIDEHSEDDRDPELLVVLYSLEIDKIENCFDNIKKSEQRGTHLFSGDKRQSCWKLAYELLVAGDALALNTDFDNTFNKMLMVTPDNFVDFVKNVKAAECKKYTATLNFSRLENEYMPSAATKPESKMCFVL